MKNILISVIMPVHNGEKYLFLAIESILKQTYRNFEFLILNDASTDNSIKIIESYKDSRMRLINYKKQLGLARIRQEGIKFAKGDLIAFQDCDDLSLPTRLTVQSNFLRKNLDIAMVGSWVKVIDHNGKFTGQVWYHNTSSEMIPTLLLFRNCFTQSSVMIRRTCFRNYSFRQEYWAAPDFDLWTRLVMEYKITNLPEILVYYRTFEKNMTNQFESEIKKCTKRIFVNSLKRLGIVPTGEEIKIHDGLERIQSNRSVDLFKKTEEWLIKLVEINNKSRKYKNDIFTNVIANYWFKICSLNANIGHQIYKKYKKSSLNKNQSNWKKNIILFILCTIHQSRNIDITSDSWRKLIN